MIGSFKTLLMGFGIILSVSALGTSPVNNLLKAAGYTADGCYDTPEELFKNKPNLNNIHVCINFQNDLESSSSIAKLCSKNVNNNCFPIDLSNSLVKVRTPVLMKDQISNVNFRNLEKTLDYINKNKEIIAYYLKALELEDFDIGIENGLILNSYVGLKVPHDGSSPELLCTVSALKAKDALQATLNVDVSINSCDNYEALETFVKSVQEDPSDLIAKINKLDITTLIIENRDKKYVQSGHNKDFNSFVINLD